MERNTASLPGCFPPTLSPEAGVNLTRSSPSKKKKKKPQDVQRTRDPLCHIEHFETRGEKHFHTAVSYWLGNFVGCEQLVESKRQNAAS